jgi:hypothetical protein
MLFDFRQLGVVKVYMPKYVEDAILSLKSTRRIGAFVIEEAVEELDELEQ